MERTRFELFGVLSDQAERVRSEYPELFSYLDERDTQLRRISARIPFPDDPESWAGFDVYEQVGRLLRRLPPGLAELS